MSLLRNISRLAFSGLTACALTTSPVSAADYSRGTLPAANQTSSGLSIWMWDCGKNPQWRKIMQVASADVAEHTVERFNRENRKLGRIYSLTTGAVPQQTPVCEELPVPVSPAVALPRKVSPRVVSHSKPKRNQKSVPQLAEVNGFPELPALDYIPGVLPQVLPAPVADPRPAAAATKSNGKLQPLSPLRHQFGRVAQGEEVRHVFRLKNAGRGPVQIELSERSCGCTAVKFNGKQMHVSGEPVGSQLPTLPISEGSLPIPVKLDGSLPLPIPLPLAPIPATNPTAEIPEQHEIAAGATALIEVSVKTSRGPGAFAQQVTLKSDDAALSSLVLQVEGEIAPVVETSRAVLDFGKVRQGQPARLQVELTSHFAEKFSVEGVDCTHPDVKVSHQRFDASELRQRQVKQGFHLDVELADAAAIGALEGDVVVYTNLPEMETIRFPLRGLVTSDTVQLPIERLELGFVERTKGTKGGLFLKLATSERVVAQVRSVSPAGLKVNVATANGTDGKTSYLIVEVELPAGAKPGHCQGAIDLRTNLPGAKLIRIPVSGLVGDASLPNLELKTVLTPQP